MNTEITVIKRVLISVSDKRGLIPFARGLQQLKIELIATGGTARVLQENSLTVTNVTTFTGFPPIFEGRVKTIHPLIAGGILGLRQQHAKEAQEQNIQWIDLVVCNLYPFLKTVTEQTVTLAEAMEQVDIGGSTMIRSAAKNFGWTGVVTDPKDYDLVLQEINDQGGLTFTTRKQLAIKAFGYTVRYDAHIHNHLQEESFPDDLNITLQKHADLRYGENPHQAAAVYQRSGDAGNSLLNAKILQGKQLSYNNLMDADAAWTCLREFKEPACVIVKHANPCGVATGNNLLDIYKRAFSADSLSAFGGIIALNQPCSIAVASEIKHVFVEVVLAPEFEPGARKLLSKKKNLRVLEMGTIKPIEPGENIREITGGVLTQEYNSHQLTIDELKPVTEEKPEADDLKALLFAWKVLKHVKSNGIVIVKGTSTVGIGAGQPSRVGAVEIALKKAGNHTDGAVLASDAFFPFRDNIDLLAGTGIRAIIQPGGSIRDKEVINACNELGIAMVFTGIRCFKH